MPCGNAQLGSKGVYALSVSGKGEKRLWRDKTWDRVEGGEEVFMGV